jgi:hypothetical protein
LAVVNCHLNDINALSHAIADSIDEIFVKNLVGFDIFIMQQTKEIDELINRVVRLNRGRYATQIIMVDQFFNGTKDIDGGKCVSMCSSAVLISINPQQLIEMLKLLNLTNKFPKNFKFLFYCKNFGENHMDELRKLIFSNSTKDYDFYLEEKGHIKGYHPGQLIHYSYFLIDDKENVKLFTFEWFTDEFCNYAQLVLINSMNKKSLKWNNGKLIVAEKFRNFHKCIFMIDLENFPKHMPLGKITYAYTQLTNATIMFDSHEFNVPKDSLESIQSRIVDDILLISETIFAYSVLTQTMSSFHISTSYDSLDMVFVISNPEFYTNYEKLLMPFDETTWLFLMIILITSLLIILIIKQFSRQLQKNFTAFTTSTPTMNMISIYFGIPSLKVPLMSSARILLAFFTFYCLIIRTGYQGVMFEFLTSDVQRPLPKTINELIDSEYKFVAYYFMPFFDELQELLEENDAR